MQFFVIALQTPTYQNSYGSITSQVISRTSSSSIFGCAFSFEFLNYSFQLNATYPRKIKSRHILIGGFIDISGEWALVSLIRPS